MSKSEKQKKMDEFFYENELSDLVCDAFERVLKSEKAEFYSDCNIKEPTGETFFDDISISIETVVKAYKEKNENDFINNALTHIMGSFNDMLEEGYVRVILPEEKKKLLMLMITGYLASFKFEMDTNE